MEPDIHINTLTPEAVDWLASACYQQFCHDPNRLPLFNELPDRLKRIWRDIATQWLTTLFPMLQRGIRTVGYTEGKRTLGLA